MGLFDPEFWTSINLLASQTATKEKHLIKTMLSIDKNADVIKNEGSTRNGAIEEYDKKWGRLLKQISMYRGVEMMMSCMHRDSDGFCAYWNWEKKPGFSDLMDKLLFKDLYSKKKIYLRGQETERWVVKAIHWYCWGCPAYHPIK